MMKAGRWSAMVRWSVWRLGETDPERAALSPLPTEREVVEIKYLPQCTDSGRPDVSGQEQRRLRSWLP